MALALLREHRLPVGAEELAGSDTDVLAGFAVAATAAGRAASNEHDAARGWR